MSAKDSPDSVRLRPFEADDAAAVHAWFNDESTTGMLLEQRESFSEDDARIWVDRARIEGGPDSKWAIEVDGIEGAAGFAALYGTGGQLAPEVGLVVTPEARGRGVGQQALRKTLRWAFDGTPAAHRVYARILTVNEPSQRMFAALGFKREGVMPGHVRRGEELLDVEIWGLARDDFSG
jgi:RimJ/RimL family protein N-acetyltransferase